MAPLTRLPKNTSLWSEGSLSTSDGGYGAGVPCHGESLEVRLSPSSAWPAGAGSPHPAAGAPFPIPGDSPWGKEASLAISVAFGCGGTRLSHHHGSYSSACGTWAESLSHFLDSVSLTLK